MFVWLLAGCNANASARHDLGEMAPGFDDLAGSDDLADTGDLAGSDDLAGPDLAGPADLTQALLNLAAHCTLASASKYSSDDGSPAAIDICKLNGAFFWNSDMDIDCDGQTTTQCNTTTDPAYQNQTSFTQSDGTKPLDAAQLPYVVVPLPSTRFDYMAQNIQPGALAIVIYNGQLNYGVFGDEGPDNIIGEASYAMAKSLGIDPNPATGGVDSGVTFFVFTGAQAVVSPIEDHTMAAALGQSLARTLIQNN